MTTRGNLGDHEDGALTAEEKAEIARYMEIFQQLQREEAEKKVRQLALQMMALSDSLSDAQSEADGGDASAVRYYAELIHLRLARRDSDKS